MRNFFFLPVTRKWFSGSVAKANAQSRTVWITENASKNPPAGWWVHTCIKPESRETNNVPTSGLTDRAFKNIIDRTATIRVIFNADSWCLETVSYWLLTNDYNCDSNFFYKNIIMVYEIPL